MKKRNARENLKSFSWIYIIVSIIYIIAIVTCNLMPELKDGITKGLGKDGMLKLNITAGIVVVLNLWYFWLCRRVANRKSEGTFYMILLILGIVGSIVSFITNKGARSLSFDAFVDIIGLYYLMQVRKEKK